ncbi:B12-binding domain-containing radical SAM protein [Nitrospina gracilis]|uniref:B12-binding domain-containing radical SAM protein n=1 Tax=Nitrospina gracilis TaxID=35801 RepID=UPI001F226DE7|nr:B12-binding domain-containing radical SAM protein [Nitrospina gracilis]MCF8721083.1 radical SAM superfamily enzyme YgiQ (UPF0313 family) [Nitrospina gracilis Nb-211]
MQPSIGLITLNAKFIHTAVSLRYLRNAARRAGYANVWIEEFTIHHPTWKIAAEIQKHRPDILGIGVYIWNRRQCFELVEVLKKQNPYLKIVLGGPEVSFEMLHGDDYTIISGEGEARFVEYLGYAAKNEAPPPDVLERWLVYGGDLPDLHVPYTEEDWPHLKNRYAYVETSRGCPYLCSFCLSALDKTVRYFDDDAVRQQIEDIVKAGVGKVKFVDRTFNLQPRRMRDLMQWLTQFPGVEFHFEVVGDLLNDGMLEFLDTVPPGMFQFEIGIQTATDPVQQTIQRKQNNDNLFATIRQLIAQDRVHVHCDLIFGLPGETYEQMMQSFEEVFALRPHEVQLGFLKFLPGAPVKDQIEKEQYRYLSTPPYEVIANRLVTAEQFSYLKRFTEMFDLFYNSQRFRFTLEHILRDRSPLEVFDRLLAHVEQHTGFHGGISLDRQYLFLAECFDLLDDPVALDLLKLDYLYHQRTFHLPEFMRARLPENGSTKLRTWSGDRKTPLVPFQHEIEVDRWQAHLAPARAPVYYAVAHAPKGAGYFTRPAVHRVEG